MSTHNYQAAYDHFERLTQQGSPVAASQISGLRQFPELASLFTDDEIIGRRRHIIDTLGSGAIRTITIDLISEAGLQRQRDSTDGALVWCAESRIETDRVVTSAGGTHRQQAAALAVMLFGEDTTLMAPAIEPPLDEQMQQDIREEWGLWGIQFSLQLSERGRSFSVTPTMKVIDGVNNRLALLK
jgi:hypothetical protein